MNWLRQVESTISSQMSAVTWPRHVRQRPNTEFCRAYCRVCACIRFGFVGFDSASQVTNWWCVHIDVASTSSYSCLPLRRKCRSCMPTYWWCVHIDIERAHRVIRICLSAEGAGKGHCDVSMESACNLWIHVCKHRGLEILDPCGHYCDSSMITC